MKIITKRTFIIYLSLMLSIVCAYAAYNRKIFSMNDIKPVIENEVKITIDTVKLNTFKKVLCAIDLSAERISLSGYLTIKDGADTSSNMINAPYRFCRKGKLLYYRAGKTEGLNQANEFIYVDQAQKKIMVSSKKEINEAGMFPEMSRLVEQLQDEHYVIVEKQVGDGYKRLSLMNQNHITCKEYSLLYREKDLKLLELFVRLRNLDEPLDSKKDKQITIRFSEGPNIDDDILLTKERIVRKMNKSYVPIGNYKGYEMIDLNNG